MTRNKSARALTAACGRDYAFSAAGVPAVGFDSPVLRWTTAAKRFFYVRSMASPFYGRAVWEGASPAGTLVRSVNPHGSAHPYDSGEAENINRLLRSFTMPKSIKGASAPAANPIDSNKLCAAVDLLDEAYAISAFMSGAIGHDVLSVKERFGFHLVMCDMADRIKKASSIVDEYREGVNHG